MSRENPTIAEYDDAITRIQSLRAALNDLPNEPFKWSLFNAGVPIESLDIVYDMHQMESGKLMGMEIFLKHMRSVKLKKEGSKA